MGQSVLRDFRSRVVGGARGRVLAVGIGSGRNLPFYGAAVEEVVGVDPSSERLAMARRAAAASPRRVTLIERTAERLPLPGSSFDTVVVTWSLCSIPDPVAALQEVRRVLKPEGQLRFAEHGLASDPGVRWWQHRLTPLWMRCAGGCHLDQKMDDLIRASGFRLFDLKMGTDPEARAWPSCTKGPPSSDVGGQHGVRGRQDESGGVTRHRSPSIRLWSDLEQEG